MCVCNVLTRCIHTLLTRDLQDNYSVMWFKQGCIHFVNICKAVTYHHKNILFNCVDNIVILHTQSLTSVNQVLHHHNDIISAMCVCNCHTTCIHVVYTLLTSANALYYNHSQEYLCDVVQTSCLNHENIFTRWFTFSFLQKVKVKLKWIDLGIILLWLFGKHKIISSTWKIFLKHQSATCNHFNCRVLPC